MSPVAPPDLSIKLTTRQAQHSDLTVTLFSAKILHVARRLKKRDGDGSMSMDLRARAFGPESFTFSLVVLKQWPKFNS